MLESVYEISFLQPTCPFCPWTHSFVSQPLGSKVSPSRNRTTPCVAPEHLLPPPELDIPLSHLKDAQNPLLGKTESQV